MIEEAWQKNNRTFRYASTARRTRQGTSLLRHMVAFFTWSPYTTYEGKPRQRLQSPSPGHRGRDYSFVLASKEQSLLVTISLKERGTEGGQKHLPRTYVSFISSFLQHPFYPCFVDARLLAILFVFIHLLSPTGLVTVAGRRRGLRTSRQRR